MTNASAPASPQPASSGEFERLERARRRVAAIKGFYIHLICFVLVLAGLLVVNLMGGGPLWVLWVFAGWGVGLAAHAVAVLGQTSRRIADWEERKIKQLMNER
jgi:hypothetical protein